MDETYGFLIENDGQGKPILKEELVRKGTQEVGSGPKKLLEDKRLLARMSGNIAAGLMSEVLSRDEAFIAVKSINIARAICESLDRL